VSSAIFDDIFNTIDYADIILSGIQKGEVSKSEYDIMLSDSCPLVTITHPEDNIWPKTITIDYGEDCTGFYEKWIAGLNTINIWDDECLVTGTAEGVNINGISYTRTITTALHWKRVCRFLVSGIVKIERTGMEPFELDFGTGECDAVATVTMGDESKEITLRFRHRTMEE
jgi:hypothetical protein